MADIKIENIIVSAQISDALDIKSLAEKIPGSNYNPDEFSGLSVKLEDPKVAVLILSSGKIVCTGAKKMEDVDNTINKITNNIRKAGFDVKEYYTIETQNIIASTNLKKEMHLSSIAKGLILQHVDYEPKHFPGLIYRVDEFRAVLILFSSGKLICTGAKKMEDATHAIDMMKEKLSSSGVL